VRTVGTLRRAAGGEERSQRRTRLEDPSRRIEDPAPRGGCQLSEAEAILLWAFLTTKFRACRLPNADRHVALVWAEVFSSSPR
jgi:hypothetical protein